ncbi:hypothetical protein [Marinobacterium sp. BA1]|uniref:hypothetical protein n=1 Tax=Marinobacterium sp. BA1 TaxID=3138931 RepID=UPI0032E65E33
MHKPQLTERDHSNLDAFLGHALDDFKAGVISREDAVSGIAHVFAALDQGNYSEVQEWLEQGRKFLRNLP